MRHTDDLVTAEELSDLEAEYADADNKILRDSALRTANLDARRRGLIRKIPYFWSLAMEQAEELAEYMQMADGKAMAALEDFEAVRFDADSPGGNPRSVLFRFTFGQNDIFEDRVLEKRFWFRQAPVQHVGPSRWETGWRGLVSEPVPIRWKPGKDLTNGLLDLVVQVWREERAQHGGQSDGNAHGQASGQVNGPALAKATLAPKETLLHRLKHQTSSQNSFFQFFGYVGCCITAEEHAAAEAEERDLRVARRQARAQARAAALLAEQHGPLDRDRSEDTDEDADGEKCNYDWKYEIFPDGEAVATLLVEDLYPSAIKYYRRGVEEQEDRSEDGDFVDNMA